MKKRQFVEYVALKNRGSQALYKKAFNDILKAITDQLKRGEEVNITGFGRFYTRKHKGGRGMNPQTKEVVTYGPSRIASFSAGAMLKRAVKGTPKPIAKKRKQVA